MWFVNFNNLIYKILNYFIVIDYILVWKFYYSQKKKKL